MDMTTRLGLPFILPSQAQKHVTHNEALLGLDALVQIGVISRSAGTPPVSPIEGDCYIVAAAATGPWEGHEGELAQFEGGAWIFRAPREGWIAWVADESSTFVFRQGTWASLFDLTIQSIASLQNLDTLGVNATAETTNRLTVASPASLLTHEGAGHRLAINKASAADTASLLFQDGWSGRAECGLAGGDDFSLKVSADGSSWKEAMRANRTSGVVDFPFGATVGGAPLASKVIAISAGMQTATYSTTSTTMAAITDFDSIAAVSTTSSLLVMAVFSGFVRSSAGLEDALAYLRPAYQKGTTITETHRNHLIGALDTQPFSGQAVNAFYMTSPASFILTPAMKDGGVWRPGYVGRCHGASMFLQGFGFSWSAIEFVQ